MWRFGPTGIIDEAFLPKTGGSGGSLQHGGAEGRWRAVGEGSGVNVGAGNSVSRIVTSWWCGFLLSIGSTQSLLTPEGLS